MSEQRYVYNSDEGLWVDTKEHRFIDPGDRLNEQDRDLELGAAVGRCGECKYETGCPIYDVARDDSCYEGTFWCYFFDRKEP